MFNTNGKLDTRKMMVLALISAMAFVLAMVARVPLVPVVSFLRYDPKDVAIAMGAFLYGPLAGLIVSVVVSLIQMFTISATGPWGFLMNVLASASFVCTAAFIYKLKRTMAGAVLGLIVGIVVNVVCMLLWNYLVVPIYMGWPQEAVAQLLIPGFLPFNLIKGGINAAIIMMLYKPFIKTLRKMRILTTSPSETGSEENGSGKTRTVLVLSIIALGICVGIVLILRVI